MDDATLDSLRVAWEASPDNAKLLAILLRGLLERGRPDEAAQLLARTPTAQLAEPPERELAARVWLAAGKPEAALPFADGPVPEQRLLRARILAALQRTEDAAALYREIVQTNPTLQDVAFEVALRTRTAEVVVPADGRRLKVVSNDDTNQADLARLLVPAPEPITFADVGGLDQIKRQITKRIILPFKKPSLFERFKKRVGGGILLYGPPGCGKTLLARATAGECGAAFFNVAISDILDMYIGESERKLHALFEKARASTPAVLFFDELEALAGKRQYSREALSAQLVSQFLSEMDGFAQNNGGVLILGATNLPWAIDAAFRRPGRFDRVLFVPPPDQPARAEILAKLLADRPTQAGIDVPGLSRATRGFSGADLAALVETASDQAIEQSLTAGHEVSITAAYLDAAVADVKPTTLEWLTTARNYARYANESGHYDEVLAFLDRNGAR